MMPMGALKAFREREFWDHIKNSRLEYLLTRAGGMGAKPPSRKKSPIPLATSVLVQKKTRP